MLFVRWLDEWLCQCSGEMESGYCIETAVGWSDAFRLHTYTHLIQLMPSEKYSFAHTHDTYATLGRRGAVVRGLLTRMHGQPRRHGRNQAHHQTHTGLPDARGEEFLVPGNLCAQTRF